MKHLQRTICSVLILSMMIVPLAGCSTQNSSSQSAEQAGEMQAPGGGNGQQGGNPPGGGTQSGGGRNHYQNGGQNQSTGSGVSNNTQFGGKASQGGSPNGTSSSQILGKVTSIVGNEVVLAVETQSGDQTSSELTLTGETKTLLIPVGLSLSTLGSMNGRGAAGFAGANVNAGAVGTNSAMPNGGAAGGAFGRTGTRTGTAKTGTTSTAKTATTTKSTSGFSSITEGMVLRITQKTVSGTLTVVKVAVVSK